MADQLPPPPSQENNVASQELALCRKLRWKGFYGARFPDAETLAMAFACADAAFSCLHTCQPWGPDDEQATPELCTPNRGCFQASPRFVRRRSSV